MSPLPPHLFTPPPLPSRNAPDPARQVPPRAAGSRTPLVYWPAVAAAALLSLFILTGLLAWLASHPGDTNPPPPRALAGSATAAKPVVRQESTVAPLPRKEPSASFSVPAAAAAAPETPAAIPVAVKENIPSPPPVVLAEKPADPVARAEPPAAASPEPNPPEPREPTPPPEKQIRVAQAAPTAPSCPVEKYGTSVDFLSNPQLASRQARTQAKLLFLLHVSGNFEDNCFT